MREFKFRAWDKRLKKMSSDCDVMAGVWDNLCGNQVAADQIIMQYTGLKDKNGVDLDWWEDDILEDDNGYKFQIKYLDDSMRFGLLCLADLPIENYYFIQWDYQIEDLKKIGNSHENPQLLK